MTARFEALCDDRVGAGLLCAPRVGQRVGGGEPGNATLLQPCDERRWIQPHDRRHDSRRCIEDGFALRSEIGERHVAGFRGYRRRPSGGERALAGFRDEVAGFVG